MICELGSLTLTGWQVEAGKPKQFNSIPFTKKKENYVSYNNILDK